MKLTLRAKIMGTIVVVTTMIVIVTTVVVAFGAIKASRAVQQAEGRGRVLERQWERFKFTSSKSANSEYGVVRLLATDPALVQALETGNPAELEKAATRVLDSLQGSIAPELFTISDREGNTIEESGGRTGEFMVRPPRTLRSVPAARDAG